jgi:hypothetical protein
VEFVGRFGDESIHQHVSVFNQTLQPRATPSFDMGCQKSIEALAGVGA